MFELGQLAFEPALGGVFAVEQAQMGQHPDLPVQPDKPSAEAAPEVVFGCVYVWGL